MLLVCCWIRTPVLLIGLQRHRDGHAPRVQYRHPGPPLRGVHEVRQHDLCSQRAVRQCGQSSIDPVPVEIKGHHRNVALHLDPPGPCGLPGEQARHHLRHLALGRHVADLGRAELDSHCPHRPSTSRSRLWRSGWPQRPRCTTWRSRQNGSGTAEVLGLTLAGSPAISRVAGRLVAVQQEPAHRHRALPNGPSGHRNLRADWGGRGGQGCGRCWGRGRWQGRRRSRRQGRCQSHRRCHRGRRCRDDCGGTRERGCRRRCRGLCWDLGRRKGRFRAWA